MICKSRPLQLTNIFGTCEICFLTHTFCLFCLLPESPIYGREVIKNLALTIGALFFIHIFAYSQSSRHYRQYLLPVFPWIAAAAGYFIAVTWKKKFSPFEVSKKLCAVAVFFFVAIDILPITVHNTTGEEIKAFQADIQHHPRIKNVYFFSSWDNQEMWETLSSFIAWYLDKVPVVIDSIVNYDFLST